MNAQNMNMPSRVEKLPHMFLHVIDLSDSVFIFLEKMFIIDSFFLLFSLHKKQKMKLKA